MILQQEAETIHATNIQLLLYSQSVALGLLVGLLTSGFEHPADIFEDARDVAFAAFEVLLLLHRANFFAGVRRASPATQFMSFSDVT